MSMQELSSGFASLLSEVRAEGRGASRTTLERIADRFAFVLIAAADPYQEAKLSAAARAHGLELLLAEAKQAAERSRRGVVTPGSIRRESHAGRLWWWGVAAAAVLVLIAWLSVVLAPKEPLYGTPSPKAGAPGPLVPEKRPKSPMVREGPRVDIKSQPVPKPRKNAPTAVAESAPRAGVFGAVMGEPLVYAKGARSGVAAKPGMIVAYGSRIETGDIGRAELQFADGTVIRLDFNTVLVVPEATGFDPLIVTPPGGEPADALAKDRQRPNRVVLSAGRMYASVTPLPVALRFQVQTPVATAEVLGTRFGLELIRPTRESESLKAVLQVEEGRVRFYNSLGSQLAPALTESTAAAGSAPTEPRRIVSLQIRFLRNSESAIAKTHFVVTTHTTRLDPKEAAYAADGLFGWSGLMVQTKKASGRLQITEIVPGSPGDRAGLAPGDMVLALNGRDVRGVWAFDRTFLRSPNETLVLKIRRGNAIRDIRVENGISAGSKFPVDPRVAPRLLELTWKGLDGQRAAARAAMRDLAARLNSASLFTNLGVLHEMDDSMGDAIRAYQEAVRLNPTQPRYRLNLGLALQKIGNHERAVDELARHVALTGWYEYGAEQLAKAHALAGRDDAALGTLDTALLKLPGNAILWLDKADALLALGRNDEAIAAARKAVELRPNLDRAWTKLGLMLSRTNALEEAEKAFLRALESNDEDSEALLGIGMIRMRAGRFADAEVFGRKAVAVAPNALAPRSFLGNVLRVLGRLVEADSEWRKAVQIEPEDPIARFNLALVCRLRGDVAQAESLYKSVIRLDPTLWAGYASLGTLYSDTGRYEEAEAKLREAVRLAPGSSAVRNSLGWSLRKQGRFVEAEPEYRRAIELDPRNAQAYMNLGVLLGLLGRLEDAEPVYREFLANLPEYPYALNGLAYHLAERGLKLDEALPLSRKAVALAPKDPDIVDTLGFILLKRGEFEEVEGLFKRAIELYGESPSAALAWRHLGSFYETIGSFPLALESFKRSLQIEPGNAEALEAIKRIGG